MPKEIKYKPDTPVSVLLNEFSKVERCDTRSFTWNAKFAGKTLAEMADGCQGKEFNPTWGLWFLHKFGEETDVNLRKKIIASIKDDMTAFSAYLTFAWLTNEEDKLLEEKFKGKLPTAEQELKDGIVARSKVKDGLD